MRFSKVKCLLWVGFSFVLGMASYGYGLDSVQGQEVLSPSGLDVEVSEKLSHVSKQGRKSGSNGDKIGYTRSNTAIQSRMFLGDGLFNFGATGEYSDYEGVKFNTLPEVKKSLRAGVHMSYHQDLTDMWGLFFKSSFEMNKGSGGSYDKGQRFYVAGGPALEIMDDFFVLGGVAYRTKLELSNDVLPYIGMEWMLTEDVTIRVVQDLITWGGYINYDVNGDQYWYIDFSTEYTDRQTSVHKHPTTGQRMALRERAWVSTLGSTVHLNDMFYVRPYVEAIFERKFDTNAAKADVGSARLKNGFGVGLQGGVFF